MVSENLVYLLSQRLTGYIKQVKNKEGKYADVYSGYPQLSSIIKTNNVEEWIKKSTVSTSVGVAFIIGSGDKEESDDDLYLETPIFDTYTLIKFELVEQLKTDRSNVVATFDAIIQNTSTSDIKINEVGIVCVTREGYQELLKDISLLIRKKVENTITIAPNEYYSFVLQVIIEKENEC